MSVAHPEWFLNFGVGVGVVLLVLTPMGYLAWRIEKRNEKKRHEIEKIIKEAGTERSEKTLIDGHAVFKRSPVISVLLLLAFLIYFYQIIAGVGDFAVGSINKAGVAVTPTGRYLSMLLTIPLLIWAIWRWSYRVLVSQDGITIKSIPNREIKFEEIDDIKLLTGKGSSLYFTILLRNGEEVPVGFDLINIKEFMRLLAAGVAKSKKEICNQNSSIR